MLLSVDGRQEPVVKLHVAGRTQRLTASIICDRRCCERDSQLIATNEDLQVGKVVLNQTSKLEKLSAIGRANAC